jgi:hypothetical protein
VTAAASPFAAIFAASLATHPSKNACAVASDARTRVMVGAVVAGAEVVAGVDLVVLVVLVVFVVAGARVVEGSGGSVTLALPLSLESPQPTATSSAAATHQIDRLR